MRCEEARAQFLEGELTEAAREHLATCPHCISHRPALESMARALDDPIFWAEPPPELEERVMQLIELSEADELPETQQRWRWPVVGIAAAVAVIVATGAILFARQPPPDWEITAPGLGPAESAIAVIAGWDANAGTRVVLAAEGLDAAPDAHTYELWMIGVPGVVSGGTFAAAEEPVELFVGVARSEYPRVAVTLEPLDGDPAPSGIFVFDSGG